MTSFTDLLRDPGFWRQIAPDLSVTEAAQITGTPPAILDAEQLELLLQGMRQEGYFQIDALLPEPDMLFMALGVEALVARGIAPVFAFVYDEFWQVLHPLAQVLAAILGADYQQISSFWAWYLNPTVSEAGWQPHRDRTFNTLRPDGMPNVVTVWIPLTDVTPQNGCMYILPAHLDPNYPEHLGESGNLALQDIRALPAPAGSVLGWNHALLHWGGRSSPRATMPRISLSCELQRGDVSPYDLPLIPGNVIPSFSQRLGLIGKQIMKYRHMYDLSTELMAVAEALAAPIGDRQVL